MEGHQILDVVFIINEAFDSKLKRSTNGVICRLDNETTYDHVSCIFVFFFVVYLFNGGFGKNRIWFPSRLD